MSKELITHRFHSKEIVPFVTATKGIEDIENVLLWIDTHQQDYKFKEGDEVAHKDNLAQKMFVSKILKKTISIKTNGGEEQPRTKMIGIECHWWNDTASNKFLKKNMNNE